MADIIKRHNLTYHLYADDTHLYVSYKLGSDDLDQLTLALPFGTSTIYSVLTMWTLEITSAQFTRRNWNLRTLPHHLLIMKCVISTLISRLATTHLSVSASTIRERTLHFGLSTFLIWTATFPPIQLTVFIYLNW